MTSPEHPAVPSADEARDLAGRTTTLVSVSGFGPLMNALERAARKGYMPDAMADEWNAFAFCSADEEINRLQTEAYAEGRKDEREAHEWIDCDERLPGEQGQDSAEVMLFVNGHCALTDFECRAGGAWGIRLGFYDAERGYFRVHGRPEAQVTHWMPLPDAPTTPASKAACNVKDDAAE